MIGVVPTAGPRSQAVLLAEVDVMARQFVERASDGSYCGRRGLYEHHDRVLRQARTRLALVIGASGETQ